MESITISEEPTLSSYEYNIMGIVLFAEGFLGMLLNGILLIKFIQKGILHEPRSLLAISLCVGDFGIAMMCPFAAAASFGHTWLFGDSGCQLYACAGILFGTISITSLVATAVSKFYSVGGGDKDGRSPLYQIVASLIWINAVFWCVTPLSPIGFGRYAIEPPKTTCMLDFADHDASYLAYLVAMTGVVYIVPMGIVLWCLLNLRKEVGVIDAKTNNARKETTKTCVLVLLLLIIYWGAYGVVALWAAIDDISNVPIRLVAAAPILAKICPIGNVVLQTMTNQNIRSTNGEILLKYEKQK